MHSFNMKKVVVLVFLSLAKLAYAQNVDIDIVNSLNSPQKRDFADPFLKGVSSSSYIISIAAPVSIFSVSLLKSDKQLRYKSYQMIAGIGFSMAMSLALKHTIERSRPYVSYDFIIPKINENSSSFPSGHTTAAFETATSLSLNFPKWYVIAPSFIWAGAVGYSRMYLGVHYPSDVGAGILLGAGSAWLTWKLNRILQKRIISRRVRFFKE